MSSARAAERARMFLNLLKPLNKSHARTVIERNDGFSPTLSGDEDLPRYTVQSGPAESRPWTARGERPNRRLRR
jgi:hypothetical protein